ncbi:hypothetical protein SARC_02850 [Sphaeroforma arctica JP610]|uniref:Prolyl 4-hydroxylase alpha subunit domain-containing protein n=1 Tax=Sphaeroforma arctica JP610 TaxID=667725 RepID=A0A0L0G7Q9_9EUKA|nr:hypothetical protein SARC_02850 [Sphaeroforma arctica JP610]KNC84959.1 hypothetical protein SARC_02850 [Sphaeroforma arctica JP610]|eukprot:XP_014158861.1 hypothetical protein SARC_02850 [Sphaeroforma arctica JP610]
MKGGKHNKGHKGLPHGKRRAALATSLFPNVNNGAAFLSAWEARQPCYMESCALAVSLKDITADNIITSTCGAAKECAYGRDVVHTQSQSLAMSKRIYEWHGDLHGSVSDIRLQELISPTKGAGNSVRFLRQEMRAPLIALAKAVDTFWKGEGGVSVCVDVVTHDALFAPPSLYSTDTLLIQTEGSLHVQLIDVADEWLAIGQHCAYKSHRPCSQFPTLFTTEGTILVDAEEPKIVQDLILNPGDVLYVPQHLIVFADTQHEECDIKEGVSTTASVALPSQPVWSDVVDASVMGALEVLGHDPDSRLFPRRKVTDVGLTLTQSMGEEGTVANSIVKEVLQTALELANTTLKHMESRCAYTHTDFDNSDRFKKMDIHALLEENDGIVKIPNVLPKEMADKVLHTLQNISEAEWHLAENGSADKNYATEVSHAFMSARSFPNSDFVLDMFHDLLPLSPALFSAGKYTKGHFIEAHDDRAYKEIGGETYSRDIACIYYLTKDWSEKDGGALLDMESKIAHIPEFNSMIIFQVPRWHEVQPMVSDRERFSIFGWFLNPGKQYPLTDDVELEEQLDGVPLRATKRSRRSGWSVETLKT